MMNNIQGFGPLGFQPKKEAQDAENDIFGIELPESPSDIPSIPERAAIPLTQVERIVGIDLPLIDEEIKGLENKFVEAFAALIKEKTGQDIPHEILMDMIANIRYFPDLFHELVSTPEFYLGPFLELIVKLDALGEVIKPIEIFRTFLQAISLTLGDGAGLILQAKHYYKAEQLLKNLMAQIEKEPDNPKLKDVAETMRIYVKVQKENRKEKMVSFTATFFLVSIRATNFILGALKNVAALARHSVGWAFCLLDVLNESIALWRARKAKTTHDAWMIEVATSHNISRVDGEELPEFFENEEQKLQNEEQKLHTGAQKLLDKRLERMILAKAEKMSIDDLKTALEENNIDCGDKEWTSLEEFTQYISADDAKFDKEFRNAIFKNLLDKTDHEEDTFNAVTRNNAQALSRAKAINEKKFFNFRLLSAKINCPAACLYATLAITLHVLVVAGVVALSAAALGTPGLGFFVLGVALTAIGLYFFYKYKPNLFKEFRKGVNLRLAFLQIPAKIRTLQLQRKQAEIKFLEKKLDTLRVQWETIEGLSKQAQALKRLSIPDNMQPALEQLDEQVNNKIDALERTGEAEQVRKMKEMLENKKEKYQERLDKARLEENVLMHKERYWLGKGVGKKEGKVTKLRKRLREAGTKDFAFVNRLEKDYKEDLVDLPLLEEKAVKEGPFDIPRMLVGKADLPPALKGNEFKFDKETVRVFKEAFGMELNPILEANNDEIITQLKDFFALENTEYLNFMKTRLNELEEKRNNEKRRKL